MDFGGGLLGVAGSGFAPTSEAPPAPAPCGVSFSPPMGSPSHASPGRQASWPFGSAASKTLRAVSGPDNDDWRCAKLPRPDDGAAPSRSASLFPEGQQMLSFSTPKLPDTIVLPGEGVLSCCYPMPSSSSSSPSVVASSSSSSPAGTAYGSLNRNLYGLPTGMRGGGGILSQAQWPELEQQAMIYKYMDANAPLPSTILASLRAGYTPPGYSAGSLASSAFGWGSSFRQGFSDPEPGRCRRTDGKKWRCSRDAVVDQKYCERHMNRGRHRSRKPVEGLSGHANSMPVVAPMPSASAAVTNTIAIAQHRTNTVLTASGLFNRNVMSKEGETSHIHDQQRLSMSISSNSEGLPVLNPYNPFEDHPSMPTAPALIASNNPLLNLSTSCVTNGAYDSHKQFHQPSPMHHFFDDWSKNQPNQSTAAATWNEAEDLHTDTTQLSISIPAASSLMQQKHSLAQLRLSREIDPVQIELGIVSGPDHDGLRDHPTWAPISWGSSMGGPLGEVLNTTNNTCVDHIKNPSSALNLMTHDWESSPQTGSTPTGVLQDPAFGSLSSSAGSSPRADNFNALETTTTGGRLCSDLIGSALLNSTAIPTL